MLPFRSGQVVDDFKNQQAEAKCGANNLALVCQKYFYSMRQLHSKAEWFELIKRTTESEYAVSHEHVVPVPQLFILWFYWIYVLYTPSQRGNRRDVLKCAQCRAASAVLDLIRIFRAWQVVPDWLCRRARNSLCAEEGPLAVPCGSRRMEKHFLVILVLPWFNLVLPVWYKKVFKVEIADASISAVVLCLPFQNKIFSKLL